mmetsp:Transcript_20193/g.42625  ORF Transcript_20193/g.42625 Transcript_20193/m.42625 type:complete len:227 (+) Transcript_20193:290-970(+)
MVNRYQPFDGAGGLIAGGIDVHGELDEAVGVAPLVVVPRDELDERRGEHNAGARVEDGRAAVALEVGGHHAIIGVAHDALVLRRLRLGLDAGLDLLVGGLLGQLGRQVNDGHIRRRYTEGHASELAIEGRQHFADSFGGTGGGRDDVLASATAAAPVLAGRTVNGLLGGGGGVHSSHQTLDNAVLLVNDLGEGRKAVGRARRVGEDVDVLRVRRVVDRHNEHRSIS